MLSRAMMETRARADDDEERSPPREREAKKPFRKEKERGRPSSSHRSLAFLFLRFGDIFKNQTDTFSRRHIKKRREEPTPYALAAAVTADESGAIDPGDNPVAFFTQLSDAFLFEPPPLPEDMTYVASLFFLLLFRCLFPGALSSKIESFETDKNSFSSTLFFLPL